MISFAHPPSPLPSWLRKAQFVSRADAKFLYNEVHTKRSYEQMGVTLEQGEQGTILDVGGNVGMFATRAAEAIGPSGTVITAEPLPATFAALQHNLAVHASWCDTQGTPCAPVTALNVGVGDRSSSTATFTFYPKASGWGTLSKYESPEEVVRDMDTFIDNALDTDDAESPLSPVQRTVGKVLRRISPEVYKFVARAAVQRLLSGRSTVTAEMTIVSDIINAHNVERVALLKVDVERAEVDVLRGVRLEDWPRIEQAAVEVHQENLAAVVEILESEGGFSDVHTIQTPDLQGTTIFMVFATKRKR